jgi:AAA domain
MEYHEIVLPTRGRVVNAIYVPNSIPSYSGNPWIEALPPVLRLEETMRELVHYPVYEESMRDLPNEDRYHLLGDVARFFTPLNVHIDLERRLSRLIRAGYIQRNPLTKSFWRDIEERVNSISDDCSNQYGRDPDFYSTSAYGFNMIGVSGIGKSLALERILRLYPQVIHHREYRGLPFTHSQLAWVKLDCPFDGSTRGLCIYFFQLVDSLLGTAYAKNFGNKRVTTDEMIAHMATVAANHGIGVLVIDEIQRLSLAKSGGVEKMFNFFVQLVNTIGVPVVLVGTYKSLAIFEGNFSQMRRGTGQGDLVWDRMSMNKEWKHFVDVLWRFQFTKKTCSIDENPELIDVLYDETQGITDLAVKAYMLAQERAIETKGEVVTAKVIRSVCHEKFRILQPAIEALRSKRKKALERFEDAYPGYLAKYMDDSLKIKRGSSQKTVEIVGEVSKDPVIRSKDTSGAGQTVVTIEEKVAIQDESSSEAAVNKFFRVQSSPLNEVLSSIPDPNNEKVYEALKARNYIRLGVEFLQAAAGGR